MTIKMRMTLMKNSNLIQIDLDLVCIVAIAVGISLLLHSASMKSSWLFKCFQPVSMSVDVFKYMCYVSMHFNVLMCVQCFFNVFWCVSVKSSCHFSKSVLSHTWEVELEKPTTASPFTTVYLCSTHCVPQHSQFSLLSAWPCSLLGTSPADLWVKKFKNNLPPDQFFAL